MMNLQPHRPPRADRLGVCSWSLRPGGTDDLLDGLRSTGVPKVQLALDPLRESPAAWAGLGAKVADAGVALVSGMFGAVGEDYTSPATIRATGGFVPDTHWDANRRNLEANLAIAAELGVTTLTTHAGFIPPPDDEPPEDEPPDDDPAEGEPDDPAMFDRLVDRVGVMADLIRERLGGQLLLETGQERAPTLLRFLDALDRPYVGVNFDPANLLLYGMGEPAAALPALMPHVRQVHLKDAHPPAVPGTWGEEVPVGTGDAGWPVLLSMLDRAGYAGDLVLEREAGSRRIADLVAGRDFVLSLRG